MSLRKPRTEWKLAELAEEAGVSPRTVRYYVQRGLLSAPNFRGPDTAYGEEHFIRLKAIRVLQARFLPLDAIQAELQRLSLDELRTLAESEPTPAPPPPPLAPSPVAGSHSVAPPAPGRRPTEMNHYQRWELMPGLELHVSDTADAKVRALAERVRALIEEAMTKVPAGLMTNSGLQIPLQGVEVTGELLGGHARVRVRQRYRNNETTPVEAIYTFPLPSDATLSAFTMTCAGRRIEGIVKEREEAFQTYDDALAAGHGAALLDQERSNVFTAQVGNLLPSEETVIEVEFLQAVTAEEGSVRWMLPTLVAPRYIPGDTSGDRTGHGTAEPTSSVPDADRISPPIGQVNYGLRMDLLVDLGREVVVESPSHAIALTKESPTRTRVSFSRGEVSLDRDLVLSLRSPDTSAVFTPLVTHRQGDNPGTFALTVVPDLLSLATAVPKQEVIFLVDVSGSMDGDSLPQAKAALRLCLRHLRETDRFNIIAFESNYHSFRPQPVPFTQRTLEDADRWVDALQANGGTELLKPLTFAARTAPDGVLVLLTDGQVGNEEQILRAVLAERKTARVYSFGIGTNVSDALLRDLARQTRGDVEFIHPGERIDEKVVAQFSRALAPRVTELQVYFDGIEGVELAPAELPVMVDGIPWTLMGRYPRPGFGKVTLRGRSGVEPFALSVNVHFPHESDRPAVEKLWAAERIKGWLDASLTGRRADAMKKRIVELAVSHQLVTRYTSFVVVEQRTGDRRTSGQPETRVVPVNAPAGWAMFGAQSKDEAASTGVVARPGARGGGGYVGGPPAQMPPPGIMVPASPSPIVVAGAPPPRPSAPAPASAAAPSRSRREVAAAPEKKKGGILNRLFSEGGSSEAESSKSFSGVMDYLAMDSGAEEEVAMEPAPRKQRERADSGAEGLLGQQLANGLWAASGAGPEPVRQARATALALLELLRQGITSSHALHGAQVKKAVEALLSLAGQLSSAPEVAELALGVAWLVAAGPRTRGRIEQAAKPWTSLSGRLGNDTELRQHVDALASR
ncbi:von Willebrand factor type A domain-containing protein [Myxococcus stipitatus DSM 14675]|uniref:von Willebrand factor type A domain-containing protein n=1 Tax=Myxococcus stipitatus (strain DSM 14675 / JCM 12634 / Mx s8) TaxID=1278073 RepID=L7U1N4_MYXSD|nr:VIT domain-containing protein [Myxococcus stipitatus]AGC42103.1 von Willebrand factor type A domain-containing protein [Myxococcus stipitatus DSM 14675]